MREIKFRAWDKNEKDFVEITSFGFDEGLWYVQAIDEKENNIDPPYFDFEDELEVMQYTGLKDKNGREIYEGDIVSYPGIGRSEDQEPDLLVVKWLENDGCFIFGGVRTDYAIRYGEVVGNIYENPELI